jgi:hypothetical protein
MSSTAAVAAATTMSQNAAAVPHIHTRIATQYSVRPLVGCIAARATNCCSGGGESKANREKLDDTNGRCDDDDDDTNERMSGKWGRASCVRARARSPGPSAAAHATKGRP